MSLQERIEQVKSKIDLAAAGRAVTLVAVTKNHDADIIRQALDLGIDVIGENRVQEAERKLPVLRDHFREFHFIGHLQSNKIRKLLPLEPTLIHSIDKFSTAQKLDQILCELDRDQDILIEVNTSGEESKEGVHPDNLIPLIEKMSSLERVHVLGLMTIAPYTDDQAYIRSCFRKLRELSETIAAKGIPGVEMRHLSMGMTHDFQIAIEEGATLVRIGTGIFGARNYSE